MANIRSRRVLQDTNVSLIRPNQELGWVRIEHVGTLPNLATMDLGNGLEKEAILLTYQRARLRRSATIDWKCTWEMILRDPIIAAWGAVALRHNGRARVTARELVTMATPVRSYVDASPSVWSAKDDYSPGIVETGSVGELHWRINGRSIAARSPIFELRFRMQRA